MDALPLVINQHQLKLMQNAASEAIAHLETKKQAREFDSNSDQENNLLMYGTQNYDEARELVQSINQQLKSTLQAWEDAPETAKPVEISLNSYQIGILRARLEQEIKDLENKESQENKLFQDLLEQLPEASPQEDAD
jgi:gas vesicle protein